MNDKEQVLDALSRSQCAALVEYARAVAAFSLGLSPAPLPPQGPSGLAGAIVRLRRGGRESGFVGSLTARPIIEAVAIAARLAATEDARYDPRSSEGELDASVWLVGPVAPDGLLLTRPSRQ